MKKIFIIAVALFSTVLFIDAQGYSSGQVMDNLVMKSKVLGKEVHYAIYLPPDYNISNRSYPVVYLLHGYLDNQIGWIQNGEVNLTADRAIADRKIPPMIIVMPDAGNEWYINDYKGVYRYEDMFFQEFIPFIESTYRIRAKKGFRGIAGLSMGGYGSLIYSLHHPDMFVACTPLSAGVFTDEEMISMPDDRYNNVLGKIYGEGLKGSDRISEFWKKNNVLELVKNHSEDNKKSVRYYIDCGDDDFLYKGNSALHIIMRDLNVPHEYRVRDGGHTWSYWRSGIGDALEFIGQSFHQM